MADAQLRLEDDGRACAPRPTRNYSNWSRSITNSTNGFATCHLAYLTDQQQFEETELKKRKLALKDRIEAIAARQLPSYALGAVRAHGPSAARKRARTADVVRPEAVAHRENRSRRSPVRRIAAVPAAVSRCHGPARGWRSRCSCCRSRSRCSFAIRTARRRADPALVLVARRRHGHARGRRRAGGGAARRSGSRSRSSCRCSTCTSIARRSPGASRAWSTCPGTFLPAYRHDAHQNERSEIWIDHDGTPIVARQVVGVLARRVVCRVKPGEARARCENRADEIWIAHGCVRAADARRSACSTGDTVRAGVTVIADSGRRHP